MTERELQQYLLREYPQENARREWKEFKNLKNSFCGDEKNDVISYVSAIANIEGGFLVVGVHDKTLEIVGTTRPVLLEHASQTRDERLHRQLHPCGSAEPPRTGQPNRHRATRRF